MSSAAGYFTSRWVQAPGNATEVANVNIYNTAFAGFRIGEASAMSVVLFLIILLVSVVQFRYFNKRITYEIA